MSSAQLPAQAVPDTFAIDLGIAMQLTNISRDVLEDAKMGRRYLPANWVDLSAAQIAEADKSCHNAVAKGVERLLDLAEDLLPKRPAGYPIAAISLRDFLSMWLCGSIVRLAGC